MPLGRSKNAAPSAAEAELLEQIRQAAVRGDSDTIVRLVGEGVKPDVPDEAGRSAMHLACSAGHANVVASLLLSGADVNRPDGSGCSPLQRAAAEGHLEVVRQLLRHGADVNHQDSTHGNTALHEASWKGFSRCVTALSKAKGADLSRKNRGGFAPLHLSCQNGHNQSCRELLLANCSPDVQNNYGDSPLHTSARYGHAGVTRILISAKSRVSDQNKNGDTALHIAAAMGRRKLTRILLEAGCDKSLKNKQGETARDIATRKDLNEILQILNSPAAVLGSSSAPADKIRSSSRKKPERRSETGKKREKAGSGNSSKDSSSRHKERKKAKSSKVTFDKLKSPKKWSPYGCHYYPDSTSFPQPNLDSLPEEPLKRGEQYFLDLAGNICKGPIGVGYTCYCAPFFKNMEARLDKDKQELKEHIDAAHARLDAKVSSLERKTHGKMEELSRCVAAERLECHERHVHLKHWLHGELVRGGATRASERLPSNRPRLERNMSRTRSLEDLLDHHQQRPQLNLNGSHQDLRWPPQSEFRPVAEEEADDDGASSESSEELVETAAGLSMGPEGKKGHDYENVAFKEPHEWRDWDERAEMLDARLASLGMRCRTGVYHSNGASPATDTTGETPNESGYSSKLSKGPSPDIVDGTGQVVNGGGASQLGGFYTSRVAALIGRQEAQLQKPVVRRSAASLV
ncbi:Hypothetical predicted protein [Cloeon dipterum]|uniref:Ankyrin repeat domain-containing protein 6 n=1 Tax=Cloeon dipterum TaxID=197152 RepID=A0A8S1BTN0_9INSE|nr:Hypothetical predicted protein [Cloeon dipterum]